MAGLISTDEWKNFVLISGIILLVGLGLQLFLSAGAFHNDYWVKHVDVHFDNATKTITERITFEVNSTKFHEIYKEYAGKQPILKVECSSGLKSKIAPSEDHPNSGNKDIICRNDKGLKPGTYTLTVTYRMPPKMPVRWVVFTVTPRRVESVSSNGDVLLKACYANEPVVAFYPHADLYGIVRLVLVYINRWAGIVVALFFIALLYIIYKIYGVEYDVDRSALPDMLHTPPKDRPSYDVALFFTSKPGFDKSDRKKLARVISAIVTEGIIDGALKLEERKVKVIDEGKLSTYNEHIKNIIHRLDGKDAAYISREDARYIVKELEAHYKEVNKKESIYSNDGYNFFIMVSFLLAFLGPFVFPLYLAASFLLVGIAAMIGVSAFGGYLLGKYSTPETFKERLMWERFAKLLKDESLLKEYGPKDARMWGRWLAYAYAFGIPKEKIVKLFELAQTHISGLGITSSDIYAISVVGYNLGSNMAASSSSSGGGLGGGSIGGGFSGGGSFGAR